MTQQITFALTKGRILKETLPLLKAAGIEPQEDMNESRKLIFATNQPDVRLLLLRGADVTTYVKHGAADIGVSGKDMLLESGGDGLYELLDLKIARCRLCTAGFADDAKRKSASGQRIKVATKFINVAKRYYAERGIQADIIKLYGAMELAPLIHLADEIVDIVDTGGTLKANGLQPLEHIADVSSRLIVNPASYKMNYQRLHEIIEQISAAVGDAG